MIQDSEVASAGSGSGWLSLLRRRRGLARGMRIKARCGSWISFKRLQIIHPNEAQNLQCLALCGNVLQLKNPVKIFFLKKADVLPFITVNIPAFEMKHAADIMES